MQRKGHRRVQAPHMQGTPHQAPPGPEPHPSLRSSLGACLSGLVGGEEALVVLPCPLWGGGSLPLSPFSAWAQAGGTLQASSLPR